MNKKPYRKPVLAVLLIEPAEVIATSLGIDTDKGEEITAPTEELSRGNDGWSHSWSDMDE